MSKCQAHGLASPQRDAFGSVHVFSGITVDEQTGEGLGTVIWTAANGDQIFAATHGEIVLFDFPSLTLRETQVITDGTGRFNSASGTIIVDRSLDLLTGNTAGAYSGRISLAD